jgi:rod shape determining protein RodA
VTALAESLVALRGRQSMRERLRVRDTAVRRFDFLLLGSSLTLCAIGAVLVWSATRGPAAISGTSPTVYLHRDALNIAIGVILGAVTMVVGGARLRRWTPWVYLLACALLLLVLGPLGATVNGHHSWIILGGGFQLQPAEVAKLVLVLALALVLGEWRATPDGPGTPEVLLVLGLAAVPIGLVLLQPDLGTVMVLVFTVIGVLMVSGASRRWVAVLLLVGVLGSVAAVQLNLLKGYQLQRFTAFLNPGIDSSGFGYSATQAKITVASGGLLGVGLGHGAQTSGGFVPEQHTDFIFTVAGEELGFLGCSVIVALLGLVLWRGLRIAARSRDPYGALVAAGVVCWFAFQTFQNIGMTVGLMPITGIPLPFLSYGGSAMFANLVAIGLLESVAIATPRRIR